MLWIAPQRPQAHEQSNKQVTLTSGGCADGSVRHSWQLKGAICIQQTLAVGQPGEEDHTVLVEQGKTPHYALMLGRPNCHALSAVDDLPRRAVSVKLGRTKGACVHGHQHISSWQGEPLRSAFLFWHAPRL